MFQSRTAANKKSEIVLKIETVLVLMSNVKVGYAKKMVLFCLAFPFIFLLLPNTHFTFNFIFLILLLLFGPWQWKRPVLVVGGVELQIYLVSLWVYLFVVVFFGICGREFPSK